MAVEGHFQWSDEDYFTYFTSHLTLTILRLIIREPLPLPTMSVRVPSSDSCEITWTKLEIWARENNCTSTSIQYFSPCFVIVQIILTKEFLIKLFISLPIRTRPKSRVSRKLRLQTSDLEISLVRKMTLKLKSIDPLQMGQKKTANVSVGGNMKPSAYVFSCFYSDLEGCSIAMCGAVN